MSNNKKIFIPKTPKIKVLENGQIVDANKQIKTRFVIDFEFNENMSFTEVMDKLDARLNEERQRAVRAIAKFLGVEIKWEGN